MKNIRIFIGKFSFFGGKIFGKIFSIFEWACFHNVFGGLNFAFYGIVS